MFTRRRLENEIHQSGCIDDSAELSLGRILPVISALFPSAHHPTFCNSILLDTSTTGH